MKIKTASTLIGFWKRGRDWLLISGVEWLKRPYARVFKVKKKSWNLTSFELMEYPKESLGSELGKFLFSQNFELMDKLEDHDVLHVLLEIDTTVKGEAIMQWVLIGNGKRSLFCLFSAMLSWLLLPEFRLELKESYRKGKAMRTFYKWEFQYLLREPLIVLKRMMNPKSENKNDKNIRPIRF